MSVFLLSSLQSPRTTHRKSTSSLVHLILSSPYFRRPRFAKPEGEEVRGGKAAAAARREDEGKE